MVEAMRTWWEKLEVNCSLDSVVQEAGGTAVL